MFLITWPWSLNSLNLRPVVSSQPILHCGISTGLLDWSVTCNSWSRHGRVFWRTNCCTGMSFHSEHLEEKQNHSWEFSVAAQYHPKKDTVLPSKNLGLTFADLESLTMNVKLTFFAQISLFIVEWFSSFFSLQGRCFLHKEFFCAWRNKYFFFRNRSKIHSTEQEKKPKPPDTSGKIAVEFKSPNVNSQSHRHFSAEFTLGRALVLVWAFGYIQTRIRNDRKTAT